jgi:glycosyltransferase involved in cell wall biosynthesis
MTPRVAFVNGGILGLLSYANYLRRAFANGADVHAEHFVLTEDLTPAERVVRRLLCQRFLPLGRFRREYNSGLIARQRLLRRGLEHFDVLHFHRQATAYASLDLMERRPAIVSMDCTQTCALQGAHGDVERWSIGFNVRHDGEIFRRAAAIVATSHWAADDLRRMYPGLGAPIHVLPNPVMLDFFHPRWADERRARASIRPQCLFMGGDFPRKGGYDLLEAWRRGGFGRRADLTLVTTWPLSGALPDGVRQVTGISGQTAAWAEIWHGADIFVMPTRNEAFGLVFQEAAAAGLPAIGTRLNAIPEIVDDGATGLLVAPGNIEQLATALERLLASAELRSEMGHAARRKIERDADPAHHRAELVQLIDVVAKTHG